MCRNESRKSLSPQLLFEVSVFTFHLVSALQYLYCYCNEYPVKQTASLYLKWPLEPAFFLDCFCYLEKYVFTYFKLIYLWISRPNSSVETNEGDIFNKVPDWKPLLLLKIKIKTQAGQIRNIMQPSSTFISISEYSRSNRWLGKYHCILGRIQGKRDVGKQVWFVV